MIYPIQEEIEMNDRTKEEELHEVHLTVEQAKRQVALRDSFEKLKENADFVDLIFNEYFQNEAARLVSVRTDFNMQGEQQQKDVNKAMDAVGYLRRYLATITYNGNQAEKALIDAEETRQEILQEQMENDGEMLQQVN